MKKGLLFLIIFLLLSCMPVKAVTISGKSGVVLELQTGQIIFEKNANEVRPMASTTKIMTALTVIEEYPELDKQVKVPAAAARIEGSSMYLKADEQITIKELLYGLLLVSGNDAANALALTTAGSIEAFVGKMNEKARELGLKNTNFVNPSGLPGDSHFTTAYELAVISARALKNKTFSEIVRTRKTSIQSGRVLVNHNKLLVMYDGCVGVKTGFTKEAGRCLVSAAERDGVTLIAVTLSAPDDWSDHQTMLNDGFSRVKRQVVLESGKRSYKVPVSGGLQAEVAVTNEAEASVISIDGNVSYKEKVLLPQFVLAPIKKGQKIGELQFSQNGNIVSTLALTAAETVKMRPPLTYEEKFQKRIENLFGYLF